MWTERTDLLSVQVKSIGDSHVRTFTLVLSGHKTGRSRRPVISLTLATVLTTQPAATAEQQHWSVMIRDMLDDPRPEMAEHIKPSLVTSSNVAISYRNILFSHVCPISLILTGDEGGWTFHHIFPLLLTKAKQRTKAKNQLKVVLVKII